MAIKRIFSIKTISITSILLINCNSNHYLKNADKSFAIKRDLVNNSATLYLKQGYKTLDTLKFLDLDFLEDTTIEINKTLWHYIYSVRCGSNCKMSYQTILSEKHNKIHLDYLSYYHTSFGFDKLYAKDTSLRPSDVMKYSYYKCEYQFNSSFFTDKPIVNEYLYKGNFKDKNRDGNSSTFILKYDKSKRIYYNCVDFLNGNFFLINGKSKTNEQINKRVYALKFKEYEWIYLNDNWYEWNKENGHLIKFLP